MTASAHVATAERSSRPRDTDGSDAGAKEIEYVPTVVIGGGQAGLATSYYLSRRGVRHVILDANERVGDAWRNRWDSLRAFTPARFSSLPGMTFPAEPNAFPTKDQIADYLEAYAAHFDLPVRTGMRVDRLEQNGDGFVIYAGRRPLRADSVVVAMSTYQRPKVPAFAADLDPATLQIHAGAYENPGQLHEGSVLVVGAGNSGAEIALELAPDRTTWLAGRDVGHIPFRIEKFFGRTFGAPFVLGFLFHRVMTLGTPIGRAMRKKLMSQGGPLVRHKPHELAAAGVHRVDNVAGVREGRPVLADGRVIDVDNVVWCTGFAPDFSWIDIPVFDEGAKEPRHERGVVDEAPGMYFVGLFFLYALSSSMFTGIGRDAEYIARHLERHLKRRGHGAGAARMRR